MNYLVTRLHKSGHTNIESILDLWRQLDKETESIKDIERFGSSIWKIWQTTDIFSTNIQNRIYSVNGHWEPMEMAAKTSSCYLFTKQDGLTTVFTILSTEKEAIGSVQSLIANIYHPVEQVNLERFFEQNKSLPVQAASIYEDVRDLEIISNYTWSKPIMLSKVFDELPSSNLLSITAIVNIPIVNLRVRILNVSTMSCQINFFVETEKTPDLQEEKSLIKGLFVLADRVFEGNQLTAS